MPACHAGDHGFKSRQLRHLFFGGQKHFHNGDDQNTIESDYRVNFDEALREFLQFSRERT